MNPFDINVPCIHIEKSEVLFEIYRISPNRDQYDIEVQSDDAIKRNQIFFDFMQRTFNRLDGLYLLGKYLSVDTIIKEQFGKQSTAEIGNLNREKN